MNGKQLGRHVGMFLRQVYEITDSRQQAADSRQQAADTPTDSQLATRHSSLVTRHSSRVTRHSQLAIRIWGSDALPKMKLSPRERVWKRMINPVLPDSSAPYPDRFATLKCQMQFGWDFAPRLRTCGIWDEASVVVTRSVFVEDAWVNSKFENLNSKFAAVSIGLTLDSDSAQTARVVVTARGKNCQAEPQMFAFALQLERGKQTRTIAFDLQDPRL